MRRTKDKGGWSTVVDGWFHYWRYGFGFGEGGNFKIFKHDMEFQVNHPHFFFIWRWYPLFSLEIRKWWKFNLNKEE